MFIDNDGGREHYRETTSATRSGKHPQPTLRRIGDQVPSREHGVPQGPVAGTSLRKEDPDAALSKVESPNETCGADNTESSTNWTKDRPDTSMAAGAPITLARKPKLQFQPCRQGGQIPAPAQPQPLEPPHEPKPFILSGASSGADTAGAPDSIDPAEPHHIVIPIHGQDHIFGGRSKNQIQEAAEYADLYYSLLGAQARPRCDVHKLSKQLRELTRKFSRAEAEAAALNDAGDFEISDELLRRDAKHLRALGSFDALIDFHNDAQKRAGLNLSRVNAILGEDPAINKIREIVQRGAIIDTAPDFKTTHRSAPFRNLQLRMLPVYQKAVAAMHATNKVLLFHVEDIPPELYGELHTANEYHWRPEPGKIAGRPLLDCSNSAPGEIPLNSEETKLLGIDRYQKVTLPTFHEVLLAWDNYRIDRGIKWKNMWMFKADISGCFNQLHWSHASVRLMGFHLQEHILMIMLTCGFGVGVTPMVWSMIGDALNRYVQALCVCIIFTFVDDFFGAGTWDHAIEAQEHVHRAIRGTLGYDGLSVKKNVFAQTAEILGFLVDFPNERVRPKTGAIEKLFFVLFFIKAHEPQTLRYWQCLASLVNLYSPVLRGMRPFVAQIIAMTCRATAFRKQAATPSALFEIQMWRAAIVIALLDPDAMAVPLHVFIENPRDRSAHPIISDASPWRLCAALYHAVTGVILAWITYRLPYAKDIEGRSQGHREYLGNLLALILLIQHSKANGRATHGAPLEYYWVNDNKGALAWAEKRKCSSLASQYACLAVSQLHIQADIYMGKPVYKPGIDMGEIDAMSRMEDNETEDSPRIRALCPNLTPSTQIHIRGGAVEKLFQLCDPSIQRNHDSDHHKAYTMLHSIIAQIA